MKHILFAAGFLFLGSIALFAEDVDGYQAQGYAFIAPGLTSRHGLSFTHVGGGGEALIQRVGIGGEIGYLAPPGYFSSGFGLGSVNGSFNLKPGKVSPFVTGGYTLFFAGGGTANGYNFGAGAHYWISDRAGLRFEVRDNVLGEYSRQHYVGFRIGVSLR